MKKFILFAIAFNLLYVVLHANIQDSSITVNSGNIEIPIFELGDTLIDLNKVNGGIVKFQIADDDKLNLKNSGFEIINPGIIKVKDTSLINNFQVEIKSFASDDEWYINTVKFNVENRNNLIYIQSDKIEMATGWRKDGKIMVVIAVVMILFFMVIGYLFYLDRKINKL
jgi:hypothetical protein